MTSKINYVLIYLNDHIKTNDEKEMCYAKYSSFGREISRGRFAEVAPAKALRIKDNRSLL